MGTGASRRDAWPMNEKPPKSIAARAGAWSARNRKKAILGWLAFVVVALWSREKLAEDSGVEDTGGWGGVTLAYNARSPEDVDAAIEEARAAGATIPREPGETFWGGYSGVFVDPDGHPWEVAHNPRWEIAADGSVRLPVD